MTNHPIEKHHCQQIIGSFFFFFFVVICKSIFANLEFLMVVLVVFTLDLVSVKVALVFADIIFVT